MMRESITTVQALLLCGITFSWGLSAGNKDKRPFANCLMFICSIMLWVVM